MARAMKTDPIRNFKFRVQIIPNGSADSTGLSGFLPDIGTLGFAVVSGLSVSNEMIQYREGGMNTHPHKMVGQSDYSPVTFSKGVFAEDTQLWNWQSFLHSWTQGAGSSGSTKGDNDYRCDIIVSIYDHPISAGMFDTPGAATSSTSDLGGVVLQYKLYNCWPASYSLTDLSAGESSIMIQQLVVNHEGFSLTFSKPTSATTSAITPPSA